MAQLVQQRGVQQQPRRVLAMRKEPVQRQIGERGIEPARVPLVQAGDAAEQRAVEHAGGIQLVVAPARGQRGGEVGQVRQGIARFQHRHGLEQQCRAAQQAHRHPRFARISVDLRHRGQRRRPRVERHPVPRAHLFQPCRHVPGQDRRRLHRHLEADGERQDGERLQGIVHVRDAIGIKHVLGNEGIAQRVEIGLCHQPRGRPLDDPVQERRLPLCRRGTRLNRVDRVERRQQIGGQFCGHVRWQAHIGQRVHDGPCPVLRRLGRQIQRRQPPVCEQRAMIEIATRHPEPPQALQEVVEPAAAAAVEGYGQRIATLQRVLDEPGQVRRRSDLEEQPHAVAVQGLHRLGEPHAGRPLRGRERADPLRILRHRGGRGAGPDRQGRRAEFHVRIDARDLVGDIGKERRVVGPVEGQEGAHAALGAQVRNQPLHPVARAEEHRLMLAVVEREVHGIVRLGQRQKPRARHPADGQKRAARDAARRLDLLVEPVQRPDAGGKGQPIGVRPHGAEYTRCCESGMLARRMADHHVGHDTEPGQDRGQRLRRDEDRLRPQFQSEQPVLQAL